ncbi:MAG: hypothetical protein M1837_006297 [Sclerophora amabilis]|nr:MAG: hypothetical protein M1837_006297 [Sclerophora amabilis]
MAKRSREDSISATADAASTDSQADSANGPSSKASDPDPSQSIKYTQLDDEETSSDAAEVMRCSLPPHSEAIPFASYEDYEVHYTKVHVNRCSECKKSFPTEHFLGLHIEEYHDPLNEARKARGEKIYGCFVEGCDRKCSSPQKRRRHLIDKHMFPKEYDFSVVNDGIDKRSSLLRSQRHRRRSSAAAHAAQIEQRARRRSGTLEATKEQEQSGHGNSSPTPKGDVMSPNPDELASSDPIPVAPEMVTFGTSEAQSTDQEMADLATSMSALKFVPPSIRFGRGKRGGFSDR